MARVVDEHVGHMGLGIELGDEGVERGGIGQVDCRDTRADRAGQSVSGGLQPGCIARDHQD